MNEPKPEPLTGLEWKLIIIGLMIFSFLTGRITQTNAIRKTSTKTSQFIGNNAEKETTNENEVFIGFKVDKKTCYESSNCDIHVKLQNGKITKIETWD